jgi:ribose transport system substrate-binding protein
MAVLCLSVAWLAACKSSPASQPLPLIQDEIQGGEPPEFTFGIIYPLVHPYYEIVTAEAERAAEALGGRLIIKAPDEANLEQQIRMIEDMVRKQVDGIAISPIDSEALTPYIDYAVEAGIPVICFETDAPNSLRLTYIGGDNEHAGGLMGQALKNIMGDEGMVLVEYGMPGMHSQKMRLNGFIDYIRDHTNIQVLEVRSHGGNEDQALYEIEQMIDAHPHFDAFISLDYLSGASSIIAWKAMGLNRYSLTFGLMPAIEEAIINGQISLAISQNEEKWGARIVGALRDLTMNKKLPDIIHLGDRIIDARDVMNKAAANM